MLRAAARSQASVDSTNRQENLVAGVEARGNLGAGESDLSDRDLAVTRLATRRIENPNPVPGTVAAKRLQRHDNARGVDEELPVRESASEERSPLRHEETPFGNELASSVGIYHTGADLVTQAQLHHRKVGVRLLGRPGPEARAQAVHRRQTAQSAASQKAEKDSLGQRFAPLDWGREYVTRSRRT